MNFDDIKADEQLKQQTLEKAKDGKKPVITRRFVTAMSGIAAALLTVVCIASAMPKQTMDEDIDGNTKTLDVFTNMEDNSKSGADEHWSYSDSSDDSDGTTEPRLSATASPVAEPAPEIFGDTAKAGAPGSIGGESSVPADGNSQTVAKSMTAAKLDDNLHFDEWLKKQSDYSSLSDGFSALGLNANNRIAVHIHSDSGTAVQGAKVILKNGNETCYSAVTDKNGDAYLFYAWNKSLQSGNMRVEASLGNSSAAYDIKPGEKDIKLTINGEKHPSSLDIMFMVDTTGSMADELTYLAKELDTLISGISVQNRISVDFYRDHGDEYVVQANGFSDLNTAKALLAKANADGGGDLPEAVDKALETVVSANWNDDAVKIAFLVLDAPAHSSEAAVRNSIQNSVAKAAERGIRLIPVMASGADEETEITCRQLAVFTGGEFVFITDHSGIGTSHREPVTDVEYEVKPLVEVLGDVIKDYV